jgi:very-short-patch-repair endonuclease
LRTRVVFPKRKALLATRAVAMRAEPSPPEELLWSALINRKLGVSFRRQVPLAGYICDFVCASRKLVVEVDGAHHAQRCSADDDPVDFGALSRAIARGYQATGVHQQGIGERLPMLWPLPPSIRLDRLEVKLLLDVLTSAAQSRQRPLLFVVLQTLLWSCGREMRVVACQRIADLLSRGGIPMNMIYRCSRVIVG